MDWLREYAPLLNLAVPFAIAYFIWRSIKFQSEQKEAVLQSLVRKINDLEEKVDELTRNKNSI